MLAAARRHDFDVIVAEDTSRLWRNLAEQSPRLAELSDLGLRVVTHDLDTRHESAEIMGAVGGAMASAYRKEIGRRTLRGLEGLARNGKPAGGRSYGYIPAAQSGTGQIEIDREQAAIVVRIFRMFADGYSPRGIAETLNAERVPSPGARWKRDARRRAGWVASAIHGNPTRGLGILNNETYRGTVIWNRSRRIRSAADSSRRRQVQNPKSDWVTRQDERLRIVSDDLRAPAAKAPDTAPRISQLKAEIGNITDAIAGGMLRASPALAARLASAEVELEQLENASKPAAPYADVTALLADLPARARRAVDQLERTLAKGDITRARHEIREHVGVVTVESDEREIRLYSEQGHVAAAVWRAAGSSASLFGSGGRI